MGAGALSDDKVAAAAQRLIPIYVDCTKKGDNGDLMSRYKVQGFPTTIYTDPDGNPLREMESRDPAGILKDIDTVVAKIAPRPTFWQPSVSAAREMGKKARKPIAVFLTDPKADLAKVAAKLTKDLGDRKTKFLWVLESGQPTSLKKYDAEAPSTVVVLDPKSDEPLARIPYKEDDKADAFNKALDDAAKLLKK